MEGLGRERPWGKLVKVDSCEKSQVLLINRECTVGRRKGCDLSFPANKLVSGDHCKIIQDEHSGQVWLEDMSTNGTVINMSKLVKKQTHMLQNGDVIYFVYRKNEPEQNIAYVYHSIKPEQPDSQDGGRVGQNAADMMEERSSHRHTVPVPDLSFSVEPVVLAGPPRQQTQEEPQPSTSSSTHLHMSCPAAAGPVVHTVFFASGQAIEPVPAQEKYTDIPEPERKRRKTNYDKGCDLSLPHSSSTEAVGPAKGSLQDLLGKAPVEESKTDKMEESLTCIICQDLLYDCVSLQPCMHTFCAACYSGWMERSSLCPTCRCPVERIRKNHILNNLVEAYLIQHPEKSRSEEDQKSMDSRNRITQDMLQPKVERSFSDEEGSSDYLFELSDNDSDTSDISQQFMICRQCPGYRKDSNQLLFPWLAGSPAAPTALSLPPTMMATAATQGPEENPGNLTGEEPSTSSQVTAETSPQEYRCPPQGCHVICTCCLQPMPDRRGELGSLQVPAQQCMLCQRPFCHIYWGCQRIGCQGCLALFSELNLTDKCLDGVLNSNNYESEILRNYLSSRGMSWKDMLKEALQGLQQGIYYLSDYRINANVTVCFCCGLRGFKELAYKYRHNIPKADLPASVTSRPDCYWGRNCRTQVKAHHAMKFNHICEQTRFKS